MGHVKASVHPAPENKNAFAETSVEGNGDYVKVDEISGPSETVGSSEIEKALVHSPKVGGRSAAAAMKAAVEDDAVNSDYPKGLMRGLPLIYPDSLFRMQWDFDSPSCYLLRPNSAHKNRF